MAIGGENPILTNVFLRIEHDTARPAVVSDMLGISPTHGAESNEFPIGRGGGSNPSNVWVLSSAWAVHSKNVREHFQWLLKSVGARSAELEMLRSQGFRMVIHCCWFSEGGYGGPELQPDIIRGLADLGVEVYFHVKTVKSALNQNPTRP